MTAIDIETRVKAWLRDHKVGLNLTILKIFFTELRIRSNCAPNIFSHPRDCDVFLKILLKSFEEY